MCATFARSASDGAERVKVQLNAHSQLPEFPDSGRDEIVQTRSRTRRGKIIHRKILKLILAASVCLAAEFANFAAEGEKSAESAILSGEYSTALEILSKKISANPEDWKARLMILDLARLTGDRKTLASQKDEILSLNRQQKIKDAPALTVLAAAVKDENPNMALKFLGDAKKADEKYAEAYLRAGDLYSEKYEFAKAEREFRRAMEIGGSAEKALIGLACISLFNGDIKGAEDYAGKAAAENPSSQDAMAVKAAASLVKKEYPLCREILAKVLSANPRNLDALAILAACQDALKETGDRDKTIARILEINPSYSAAYVMLANLADSRYSFPEALEWTRKAIAADPRGWEGYYHCGICLIRLGEQKEGYRMLDKSFSLNPYNIPAYNVLQVLDRDFRKKEFAAMETEHFVVKMHRAEADIIWPYMKDFLEETYTEMTSRYSFTPSGPKESSGKILLLLLPTHQDFSVLTVGLPSLNAAGVCFGKVIAMPSPRLLQNSPVRELFWKAILRHEFAHVITLQKTDYRIPRWFTEGISGLEQNSREIRARAAFSEVLEKKLLLPIENLETGFVTGGGLMFVYYEQARIICEHIAAKYGHGRIVEMLDLYRDGSSTIEALEKITGKKIGEVAAEFDAVYAEKDFQFRDFLKSSGLEAVAEKRRQREKEKPEEAALSRPDWETRAKSLLEAGNPAQAIKFLDSYTKFDNSTFEVHKMLAGLYLEAGDKAKAILEYEHSFSINPFDPETHLAAARLYRDARDKMKAEREYRILGLLDKATAAKVAPEFECLKEDIEKSLPGN